MSDVLITITGTQLAERLQTNPATIRAYRSGQRTPAFLAGLPDPIQSQPRLLWLMADIEAWVESRRTFRADTTRPTTAAPSKRGRPPKARRAELKKGGAQ